MLETQQYSTNISQVSGSKPAIRPTKISLSRRDEYKHQHEEAVNILHELESDLKRLDESLNYSNAISMQVAQVVKTLEGPNASLQDIIKNLNALSHPDVSKKGPEFTRLPSIQENETSNLIDKINENLEQVQAEDMRKLEENKAEASRIQTALDKASKDITNQMNEAKGLERDKLSLQHQLNTLSNEINLVRLQLENLTGNKNELEQLLLSKYNTVPIEQNLTQIQMEFDRIKSDYSQLSETFQAVFQTRDRYKREFDDLQNRKNSLLEKRNRAESVLARIAQAEKMDEETIRKAEKAIKDLDTRRQNLQVEYNHSQQQYDDADLQFSRQKENMELELDQVLKPLMDQENRLHIVRMEISNLQREERELIRVISDRRENVDLLRNQLEKLNSERSRRLADLSPHKQQLSDEIRVLEHLISRERQSIEELMHVKKPEIVQEKLDAESVIASLENLFRDLDDELQKFETEYGSQSATEHEKFLNEKRPILQDLQRRMDDLQSHQDSLQRSLESKKREKENFLKYEWTQVQDKINQFRDKLRSMENDFSLGTKNLAPLDERLSNIYSLLKHLQNYIPNEQERLRSIQNLITGAPPGQAYLQEVASRIRSILQTQEQNNAQILNQRQNLLESILKQRSIVQDAMDLANFVVLSKEEALEPESLLRETVRESTANLPSPHSTLQPSASTTTPVKPMTETPTTMPQVTQTSSESVLSGRGGREQPNRNILDMLMDVITP